MKTKMNSWVLVSALTLTSACAGVQLDPARCAVTAERMGRAAERANFVCALVGSVMDISPEKCERLQFAAELAHDTFTGVCALMVKP